MSVMSKIKNYLFDSGYRFRANSKLGLYNSMSDEEYIRRLYKFNTGKELNLDNPITYNEKMQWLKIYDRNPLYTTMVDKYEVKKYVGGIIGDEYIIPTIGVWNDFDNIDFDSLPNQFVLKCTHDSGGLVICQDKKKFDIKAARRKIKRCMKLNFYYTSREWPYKNVKPQIIAEKYMEDESGELRDYKFFCFDGAVKCLQVDYDRFTNHHRNIYDKEWNLLPFTIQYPSKENVVIPKPQNFEKMLEIAKIMSKNIPHVRIDLYNIQGEIYFGEMTFFHGAGFEKFTPEVWDRIFGDWISLPNFK